MPRKNVIRSDAPGSFYHVYMHGHGKRRIFVDEEDFLYFLNLLERYLAPDLVRSRNRLAYPNFYNKVELSTYCLMSSSFHLLIYQHQVGALSLFMRSLMTSYSIYFNKKYKRSGPLFESRFRSSAISDETYLEHVTRYVHLIPRRWRDYEYSSLPYYLQRLEVSWLSPGRVLNSFSDPRDYEQFMEDREDYKKMKDILKHELADQA